MPAVFLDRDGVLNENIQDGYVTDWASFRWLPGAMEAIRRLNKRSWNVFVVSNQACIGKGLVHPRELEDIHRRMLAELVAHDAYVTQVYVCPHTADFGCLCRKPEPGMLLQAAKDHRFALAGSYLVGDALTDLRAAQAAGCSGVLVRTGRGALFEAEVRRLAAADHICDSIGQAVDYILNKEGLAK